MFRNGRRKGRGGIKQGELKEGIFVAKEKKGLLGIEVRARSLTISPRSIRHLFPPRRNKEGRKSHIVESLERNWPQAKALFSREWE